MPGRARLRVRIGFPRAWTPDEAFEPGPRRGAGGRRPATRGWPSTRHRCGRPVSGPRVTCSTADHPLARGAGGRARQCARRAPGRRRARQHHRRAVLPQPVRPARPGLRPAGPQHPRRRRGGGTGQHRAAGPRPWPGSSPGSTPPAACPLRRGGTGGAAMTGSGCPRGGGGGWRAGAVRCAADPDHAADRGRAHRRAARDGDRARASSCPASGCRPSAISPRCWRSAGPPCGRRCSGCRPPGYVTTRRGRGGGTFVQTGQGADSDDMIRRTLLPGLGGTQRGPRLPAAGRAADRADGGRAARHAATSRRSARPSPRTRGPSRPRRLPAGRRRPAPGDRAGDATTRGWSS